MFQLRSQRAEISGRRPRVSVLAGLATLAIAATSVPALAQSTACDVLFTIDNASELKALQFDVDQSGVEGGFLAGNACVLESGVPGFVESSLADGGDTFRVGWADTGGFTGPTAFATCTLIATGAVPDGGDLAPIITDAVGANPPAPADPQPVFSVSVSGCATVDAECGNGVLEDSEECDDGNATGGDGCSADCFTTASCAEAPLSGCLQAEKTQLKLKDDLKNPTSNAKDQGAFQWKKGEAIDVAEFLDPVTGVATYSWCVYDDGTLIDGADVAAGGTCDGKPCWKAAGTSGFQYKSKTASTGIAQIKMKAGADGKTQVQVKGKSKAGNHSTSSLPLTLPAVAQVVISDGDSTLCVEGTFTTAKKNTEGQVQAP
jgi:cysteine-rich repeat protein